MNHSISEVGRFILLKTDNGDHTSRQWARVTVGQIVQIDPTATPARINQILILKKNIVEAIEPFFGISTDVTNVFESLMQVVKNSPWSNVFDHPSIKIQILECLGRNLITAKKDY